MATWRPASSSRYYTAHGRRPVGGSARRRLILKLKLRACRSVGRRRFARAGEVGPPWSRPRARRCDRGSPKSPPLVTNASWTAADPRLRRRRRGASTTAGGASAVRRAPGADSGRRERRQRHGRRRARRSSVKEQRAARGSTSARTTDQYECLRRRRGRRPGRHSGGHEAAVDAPLCRTSRSRRRAAVSRPRRPRWDETCPVLSQLTQLSKAAAETGVAERHVACYVADARHPLMHLADGANGGALRASHADRRNRRGAARPRAQQGRPRGAAAPRRMDGAAGASCRRARPSCRSTPTAASSATAAALRRAAARQRAALGRGARARARGRRAVGGGVRHRAAAADARVRARRVAHRWREGEATRRRCGGGGRRG